MKILKEDIKGISDFLLEGSLDYKDYNTGDLLVKSIDLCDFKIQNLPLDGNMTLLKLEVKSIITYLDARSLKEIKMNIDFVEDIPFSFNENQSEEMDIDYFGDELNLKHLIFELIMVNVPFNYSEDETSDVLSEDKFYEQSNQPFAKIFEKEE